MNIIDFHHVNKTYFVTDKQQSVAWYKKQPKKPFHALKNCSITLAPGEKVALLGANGSGKSTTMKLLTGILEASSGSIEVCGCNPIRDREKLIPKIGTVFGQTSKLNMHLTPRQSYDLLARIYKIPPKQFAEDMAYFIQHLKGEEILDTQVQKLSLGQRMRAEFIASLLHRPEILFLDEPTIGLDMIAKSQLRDVINELHTQRNITILLTSHDIGDIEQICDRVIVLSHGEIVYDNTIDMVRKTFYTTKHISVQFQESCEFIPIPPMKVLEQDAFHVNFEIPQGQKQLLESFEYILRHYKIEDITIHDPEIETVLQNIYLGKPTAS